MPKKQIPWKVRYYSNHDEEYESSEWYYKTKQGAYQDAGQAILTQYEFLKEFLDENEKTPELMGTIAQIYQDAKSENWESVFKLWKSIASDHSPNIYVKQEEPDRVMKFIRNPLESNQIEFMMEWIKE